MDHHRIVPLLQHKRERRRNRCPAERCSKTPVTRPAWIMTPVDILAERRVCHTETFPITAQIEVDLDAEIVLYVGAALIRKLRFSRFPGARLDKTQEITVNPLAALEFRLKRARMAKAAERYADFTVVTSDNSRGEDPDTIISDIVKGFDTLSYKIIKDRKIAIIDTLLSLDTGDIVAIIGKGAEKYNIDRGGYHSFDEKAIVSEVLKLRKEKKDNENKA